MISISNRIQNRQIHKYDVVTQNHDFDDIRFKGDD
jgi:hypothetical protein